MDRNRKTLILGVGLIVFIAALYIIFLSAPQGPNPQPFVSNITVVNSNGSNINGVYVLNGVVENKNPFSISVVNLNATGFNANGSAVTTGDGFTTQSPIPAGGTSNFSISLYDPNKVVTTYNVRVVDASK
jgi:LEA14-like dessication related protein